jgi:peptidyl-Lys metalloendopeptidase
MKRVHHSCVFCVDLVIGWLLGACAPTPTVPAVDPSPAGLSATLEAPSSLPHGAAVNLTFALTNHSPERLYVITWYTPLERILGEIFRVERDGQTIAYEGPLVMRGDPLPEDCVLLEPGASVSAGVDLATVYDLDDLSTYVRDQVIDVTG